MNNRLGIDWLKNDLEDLSFRFLKPDIARSIEKKMAGLKNLLKNMKMKIFGMNWLTAWQKQR